MADFKIKYSLWCNNCVVTRYTDYEDHSDPLPTDCPVCSSTNIDDIAIADIINRNTWEVKENGEATTNDTSPQVASKVTVALETGAMYRLHWYCEIKTQGGSSAYARMAYNGTIQSGVVGDESTSDNDYHHFSGVMEFTATETEDVDIGLLFWSGSASKTSYIRRRRIFVQQIATGAAL